MFVSKLVKFWLFASSLIVTWDYLFVLLRPATFPGGSLFKYWGPYSLYIEIDTLYNDEKDRYVVIQSWFNCAETILNMIALLILVKKSIKFQTIGALFSLMCLSFTFWKTFIYFAYDAAFINFNKKVWELALLFFIPNGFWFFVPLLSMISISKNMCCFVCKSFKRKED